MGILNAGESLNGARILTDKVNSSLPCIRADPRFIR